MWSTGLQPEKTGLTSHLLQGCISFDHCEVIQVKSSIRVETVLQASIHKICG